MFRFRMNSLTTNTLISYGVNQILVIDFFLSSKTNPNKKSNNANHRLSLIMLEGNLGTF